MLKMVKTNPMITFSIGNLKKRSKSCLKFTIRHNFMKIVSHLFRLFLSVCQTYLLGPPDVNYPHSNFQSFVPFWSNLAQRLTKSVSWRTYYLSSKYYKKTVQQKNYLRSEDVLLHWPLANAFIIILISVLSL